MRASDGADLDRAARALPVTGSLSARVFALARLTVAEALRTRLLLASAAVGLIAIAYVSQAEGVTSLAQVQVVRRGICTAIAAFVSFIVVFLTAFTLPGDVESRRIYSLISKPLPRAGVLLGRWLGAVLTALMLYAVFGIVGLVLIAISTRESTPAATASCPVIEPASQTVWGNHTIGTRAVRGRSVPAIELRDFHESGVATHFTSVDAGARQPVAPARLVIDVGKLDHATTLTITTTAGTATVDVDSARTPSALADALAGTLDLAVTTDSAGVLLTAATLGEHATLDVLPDRPLPDGAILPADADADALERLDDGRVRARGRDGIILHLRLAVRHRRELARRTREFGELTFLNPDDASRVVRRPFAIEDRKRVEIEVPADCVTDDGRLDVELRFRDLPIILVVDPTSLVILRQPTWAPWAYAKALTESFLQVVLLASFVIAAVSLFTPFTGVIAGFFAWTVGASVAGVRQSMTDFLGYAEHSRTMSEQAGMVADPFEQASATMLSSGFGEVLAFIASNAPDFYRFGIAEVYFAGYDTPLADCLGAAWYYLAWSLGFVLLGATVFTLRDTP